MTFALSAMHFQQYAIPASELTFLLPLPMPSQSWSFSSSLLTIWNTISPSLAAPWNDLFSSQNVHGALSALYGHHLRISLRLPGRCVLARGRKSFMGMLYCQNCKYNSVSIRTVLNDKDFDNFPWLRSRCREGPEIKSKSLHFPTTLSALCHCKCQEIRFKDNYFRVWEEELRR